MNFFKDLIMNFKQDIKDQSFNVNIDRKPKGIIPAIILFVLIVAILEWFLLIPLNLRSPSFLVFFIFMCLLFTGITSAFTLKFGKLQKFVLTVVGLVAVYLLVGNIISMEVFHASEYQKQLSVDEKADFYADNEKVNFKTIPVVDKDSAQRLGNKQMGTIVDYVSQFEVDSDYTQINFDDEPYRVTTISYSDLIKWFTNHGNGIPAYIRVNMVNQDAEVVRLEKAMKYSYSDMFFRNINRHLFLNYPTLMFENPSFEIDEKGTPYYIASSYEYKIGLFGGRDITGAVLINAITGESKYYKLSDIPEWVDRVFSAELLQTQLQNWGKYKKGYFNTLFSQIGVLRPTEGYNYVAINDDVYLYTGLTSVSSDASNVGFMMINSRTKEAKYYAITGAEEYSAMSSAEGKVQNLGYKATFPILINAGGAPTYFLSLKDDAGLVKKYAFVSVKNYQIVATGDSVEEAQQAYYNLLSKSGDDVEDTTPNNEVTAKVTSIKQAIVDGNTNYYLKLEGKKEIYIADIKLNSGLPFLEAGKEVTMTFKAVEGADYVVVKSIDIK